MGSNDFCWRPGEVKQVPEKRHKVQNHQTQDGKWLKLHQSELVKLGVQEAGFWEPLYRWIAVAAPVGMGRHGPQ